MFQARKVSGHVFVYVRDFTSVSVMFLLYFHTFFYNSMYLHQFLYMCAVVQFLFIYIEMVACYSSILPYVFIDHSQRCTLYKNKNVDIYFSPRFSNNLHQIHPTTFIKYIQQPSSDTSNNLNQIRSRSKD